MTGHVVLVGAGHANLLVVRAADRLRAAGLEVTLVDPGVFWYSGMAAAVAGGAVDPGRDRVDPGPLARRVGVRVVRARAVALDPAAGHLDLDDGTRLEATAVVVNVGSEVDPRGLPLDLPNVTPAKPTTGLLDLHDRLRAAPPGRRVVVVGSGASAVELAGNLTSGAGLHAARPRVTIVGSGPLVPPVDADVRAYLTASLVRRGVALVLGPRVVDLTGEAVVLDDGRELPADEVVLATGLRAAPAVARLGLGDEGGMPTTTTLQHPEHPNVFGAGDAIRFAGTGLPRLGVFAVRQAPVLVDNLLALHAGTPLRNYEPQERLLTAVDLGGGDAVLMWRDRRLHGRLALVVKRLLDEWFLRRHRVPLGSSGRAWQRGDATAP
jgi:NADH dehydrogenase FAD-containing subunit